MHDPCPLCDFVEHHHTCPMLAVAGELAEHTADHGLRRTRIVRILGPIGDDLRVPVAFITEPQTSDFIIHVHASTLTCGPHISLPDRRCPRACPGYIYDFDGDRRIHRCTDCERFTNDANARARFLADFERSFPEAAVDLARDIIFSSGNAAPSHAPDADPNTAIPYGDLA